MNHSPAPDQLHLQFGADAARQVVASWASEEPTKRPCLRLGTPSGGIGTVVDAVERSHTDALTGQRVWTYHAVVDGLEPDTDYVYEALHPGSASVPGRFRTGPLGRSRPFRFTSFGDLSIPRAVGRGIGPSSPNAGYAVDAVEAADPLFHLVNGDLAYANASDAPVETWAGYFANTMRSARNRPWMPCAGNHENETGNGPQGYRAYQTRFFLPDNGGSADFIGNWYAFTVGAVRFITLNADDVCVQDGGFSSYRVEHLARRHDSYIRGYSGGAQRAWLEATLAAARGDAAIDWIIVCMHQVAMSSTPFNGADLGIREDFLPLFDRYGVDLVVSGHEHYYQRTNPVRGVVADSPILTPAVAATTDGVADTSVGTVHLTIGVGGNPTYPSAGTYDGPAEGLVICEARPGAMGQVRVPRKEVEPANWLAARSVDHPYGVTVFDVDPSAGDGLTRISVVHYGAAAGSAAYEPVDRVVLHRPRADSPALVRGRRAPLPLSVG